MTIGYLNVIRVYFSCFPIISLTPTDYIVTNSVNLFLKSI